MDLIEQAAKRLEQLRQAGVDLPQEEGGKTADREITIAATTMPSHSPASGTASQSRRIELDMGLLEAHRILTPNGTRTLLADEMRVIKRPLLNNVMGKGAAPVRDANLILVTSAIPDEGKTFVAANLAMSMAMELDYTVLLVDADVSRPSLPELLGLGAEKGLLDVLTDPTLDLSKVLLRTNVEKLTLLPAGTPHPRATELLASDAMNNLLAEMARRYSDRIIIFDSPPLLVTTEARALAMHMGQVVLVVKAGGPTHAEVVEAIAALDRCPVKMVVLNQASGRFTGHGYGYGYGYRYGYGYGDGESTRAAAARTAT